MAGRLFVHFEPIVVDFKGANVLRLIGRRSRNVGKRGFQSDPFLEILNLN